MSRPKPDPADKAAGLQRNQRKYRATVAGKTVAIRQRKRQQLINYHKVHARTILGNAIKAGNVTSQPCLCCLNPKTEAHHYDYDKPLSVIWLCRSCHRSFHKLQTEQP